MSAGELVIATRESRLALWQARFVQQCLRREHPGLTVTLLGLSTRGDRWLNSPLAEVGGKGLFIKELEQALQRGEADLAVHSVKDVPAVLPHGFHMPVIGFRGDPRDALVSRGGAGLADLPSGARVGSSSLRRQAQLLGVRSDLHVFPIRGNVDTRLQKMDAGEADALVLAAAGLERLGLSSRVAEFLDPQVCLPAAGQGALGIECRVDDEDVMALLAPLRDDSVQVCVSAERTVSEGLGADCSAPLAAYAVPTGDGIVLRALLAGADGMRMLRAEAAGHDPRMVGMAVVASLREQGADALLAAAR